MALTSAQIDHLMHQSISTILKFIEEGRVVFPDDLIKYKSHPKYKEIERRLGSMPDPEALRLFSEIESLDISGENPQRLSSLLSSFINSYGNSEVMADQVAKAKTMLGRLTADIEENDWMTVDRNSIMSLLHHRHRYPATVHEDEIEQMVWSLTDRCSEMAVTRYINEFPSGRHIAECQAIAKERDLWLAVSDDPDLLTLADYLLYYPSSPFHDDAERLFLTLKAREIDGMRRRPATYNVELLKLFLKHGVYTADELKNAGVATDTTLEYIYNPPLLPNIEQPEVTNPEVYGGATDVFLFGIPSSGKTCVLMGLLGAADFDYDNSVKGGGSYADDLKIYRDHGKAPGRTVGNFVAQIPGRIFAPQHGNIVFPVNLIEMSGEEFAMKIAYNSGEEVNFENMGTGATKLLTSSNRKVIFIVIDPTATGTIRIATTRKDGTTDTRVVQQDIVIAKIINMLARNPEVLKKTNAIHFVMTKSDVLGERSDRESIAVKRLTKLYGPSINRLRELSHKYSINSTSDFSPLLFTYSLGKFYVGDQFEYDAYDADKIMDALKSMAQGVRPRSFMDKLKDSIN